MRNNVADHEASERSFSLRKNPSEIFTGSESLARPMGTSDTMPASDPIPAVNDRSLASWSSLFFCFCYDQHVIIFLYGSDSYRRKRKLDEILAQYRGKHGAYTMQSFDCDEDDDAWLRLTHVVNTQSLFGKAQLFVVRNYFPVSEKLEKQCEAFLRVALGAREYTIVLLADDMPKKRFAFVASAPALAQEFGVLTAGAFEQFIQQEASRVGARLTPALLRSLAHAYEGDSWGVVSELEKMALGAEMTAASSSATNVFAASGVLARSSHDAQTTLPLLERLLRREDPAYIFNCLAYQMRGNDKLRFADYDIAVKSGRTLYDVALLDYILAT